MSESKLSETLRQDEPSGSVEYEYDGKGVGKSRGARLDLRDAEPPQYRQHPTRTRLEEAEHDNSNEVYIVSKRTVRQPNSSVDVGRTKKRKPLVLWTTGMHNRMDRAIPKPKGC